MNRDEIALLCSEAVRRAIIEHRNQDPLRVALDHTIPEARLVATQVKYLQRARQKLPSYAEAGCILPPLAFEQASSEQTAAHKPIGGERVLDLTCGLGVDAAALSRRFEQVITLERNEALATIARENFARLGLTNIEVIHCDAETYLARCNDHFDWIYADPDRRSAEGKKLVRLEDCSPNILALRDRLRELSPRLCLKNSPLFDVDEALRLFPQSRVEVLSLDGECKEVVIYDDGEGPSLTATALGVGSYTTRETVECPLPERFDAEAYRWLVIPDVALQKCRLVRQHLSDKADVWSENGYGFAVAPPDGILGRWLPIERIDPFDPKRLKRTLKGERVELFKHDFPIPLVELRKRLGVKEGNTHRLAFTKIGPNYWTIHLK